MKKALVTIVTNEFISGYIAWIKSLKKHNKITYDIIIIHNGLSNENIQLMRTYHQKLIFRKAIKNNYKIFLNKVPKHFHAAFYKLDVFAYIEYDRIVFIDCDTLILGNISELMNCKAIFAACNGYGEEKETFDTHINSGVFVINKPIINVSIYKQLLISSISGKVRHDQDALRRFFKIYFEKNIPKLESPKWNYKKHIYASKKWKNKWDIEKDIKILHFISYKPWQDLTNDPYKDKLKDLYDLWWKYYNL